MKSLPDDIHGLAGVPPAKNPDIYNMTVQMIASAVDHCNACQMSAAETRRVIGKKKDELIKDLIVLREQGIAEGENDEPRKKKRVRFAKASKIKRVSA